jgi:hypothetical protein
LRSMSSCCAARPFMASSENDLRSVEHSPVKLRVVGNVLASRRAAWQLGKICMNFEGSSARANSRTQIPGRKFQHSPSAALIHQPPTESPWGLKQDPLIAKPKSERDRNAVIAAGPARATVAVLRAAQICSPDRRGEGKSHGYCGGYRRDHHQRGFAKHSVSLGWRVIKPLQIRPFWRRACESWGACRASGSPI